MTQASRQGSAAATAAAGQAECAPMGQSSPAAAQHNPDNAGAAGRLEAAQRNGSAKMARTDGEEGHACLARHRLGQQCLSGACGVEEERPPAPARSTNDNKRGEAQTAMLTVPQLDMPFGSTAGAPTSGGEQAPLHGSRNTVQPIKPAAHKPYTARTRAPTSSTPTGRQKRTQESTK